MDSENIFFGPRVAALRQARGWSLQTLAQKVDIRRQTLHMYEHGKAIASLPTAIALAQVLGVSLDYLCGLTADPHPYPPHPGCDPDEQGSTP